MGDIMYIAVQRIISCQKLLERHIDECKCQYKNVQF